MPASSLLSQDATTGCFIHETIVDVPVLQHRGRQVASKLSRQNSFYISSGTTPYTGFSESSYSSNSSKWLPQTGMWPVNSDIFENHEFAPSDPTDQPQPEPGQPVASDPTDQLQPEPEQPVASDPCSAVSPCLFILFRDSTISAGNTLLIFKIKVFIKEITDNVKTRFKKTKTNDAYG